MGAVTSKSQSQTRVLVSRTSYASSTSRGPLSRDTEGENSAKNVQSEMAPAVIKLGAHEVNCGDVLNGSIEITPDDENPSSSLELVKSIDVSLVRVVVSIGLLAPISVSAAVKIVSRTATLDKKTVAADGGSFTFQIPSDAVPSVAPDPSRRARIEVKNMICATVNFKDGSTKPCQDEIFLVNTVAPANITSVDQTDIKNFGNWRSCIIGDGDGSLSVQVKLEHNAFAAGETAKIDVDISNDSNYGIRGLTCSLCEVQHVSSVGTIISMDRSQGPTEHHEFSKGHGESVTDSISIPINFARPTVTTNLGRNTFIEHNIRVVVHTNYAQKPDMIVSVPIILYGPPNGVRSRALGFSSWFFSFK
ncbi:Hypothetical Protein FCC1311_051232 [Hondaea fermentalgiana]|uniref:Arrestin C-terminal-like domain-containing protein n=1 Tax=Hondaea fermentalgiana TaxID=2315210 RepID=A0A2R5GD48_9STRA|nr:Hypothetical Protein FCC1311_051232 [Hondaea fermentalgiana]|eukprot:GBG28902.1 Hypothetical Protein FCC1311_051232 [Hondaea fermentalgiana]